MTEKVKTAISIENITVSYNSEKILKDVSLEIQFNQIVGFIGPNGAGKTTLIRTVAGLIKPVAGRIIFWNGKSVPGLSYVPQQDSHDPVYPLTVFEVAVMGLYNRLSPWTSSRKHYDEVIEMLTKMGLAHLIDKHFSILSGGQRQRLLLARALLGDPEILLLDEPFSGIDFQSAEMISNELKILKENHNKTILLIHHDPLFLKNLADRIIKVEHGKVS